ncbi:MAG: sugar-binding protein, partial [Myxococcota bacterium]
MRHIIKLASIVLLGGGLGACAYRGLEVEGKECSASHPCPDDLACVASDALGTYVCAACTDAVCSSVPPTGYLVHRAATVPDLADTTLSDFAAAATITLTVTETGTTGTYRLLWDDTALYVAASVQDDDLASIIATRDGDLWGDDSIELELDRRALTSDGDAELANVDDYKLFVNLLNAQRDDQGGGYWGNGWDGTWTSHVTVQGTLGDAVADTGYVLAMSLPWSAWSNVHDTFTAPLAGDIWGLDIVLNDLRGDDSSPSRTWKNTDGGTVNNPGGWGSMTFAQ